MTEVHIDKRGLICVNDTGGQVGDEYHKRIAPDGTITLTPVRLHQPEDESPNTLPEDATTLNPDFPYGHMPEGHYDDTPSANLSEHLQQFKWEAQTGHPNNLYQT